MLFILPMPCSLVDVINMFLKYSIDVYKRQGILSMVIEETEIYEGTEYYEYTRQDRPISAELVGTSLPNG